MKNINKYVEEAQQSGIRHISDFVDDTSDVIQLTVGEIDLPTPEKTKLAGINAIKKNFTKYTSNAGTLELRKVISTFVSKHYGMAYDYKNEITVTVGVSEGIDLTLRTLCNAGDEIIMASPAYPAYITSTKIAGAKPIFIDTSKTDFKLTPELLKSAITSKTKAVILNYPNNPTGTILSVDELAGLAEVIKKNDLYVITDDVYDLLVYGSIKQSPSIVTLPGMKERTVVLNGLSKSHSMTGWRIGYVLAPKLISQEMFKVHQTNVGGASSISQAAAIAAMTEDSDNPAKLVPIFAKRKKFITDYLDKLNVPFVNPEGAFYIFADIHSFKMSSWDFSIWLLKTYKLAVVPGTAFSEYAEGYIRISYAADLATLKEAMSRLESALKSLKIVNE
ncbi:aminotransferase class I/II-fold pyridoxal phosphate-dependent enzyme [Liquorilactobacillus uvarum]|uniref:aminotransferase class I/II-fold pyridoxal phosphate-dependent enzyme n=1 Tax=Liquorilactobacillus uvarum TaxID=303240 RepID=UPI00288A6222|nr:aminotransferase class I/II-fold pyridoxal phosphate-dependent enzyme [Liquorilactobacillus uvarum]